jgi:hypothetical protein
MLSADGLLRRAEVAVQESKRHERSWSTLMAPRGARRIP